MKKSLIALAVLAASGAAMAQSSVTLYGIADVWVGRVTTDLGAPGSTRTTKSSTNSMVSGGVSTSRWGMKGTEDLGGGLKAEFQLEQRINIDDGLTGTGFDRQAWVGLAGGFGAVRIGRNSTPYDDYTTLLNGVFDADVAAWYLAKLPSALGYTGKTPNSIKYISPNMGGFTGAASYAMHEKAAGAKEVASLGLNYSAGPLGAQLMYQQEEVYQSNVDSTFLKGAASYNFGIATVKGYIAQSTDVGGVRGADVDEAQVAVDFPLSSSMTLSANYVMADYNRAAGNKEVNGLGVALAYSLSKRTTLYAGYGIVVTDYNNNVVGGRADDEVQAFAVGVKHAF